MTEDPGDLCIIGYPSKTHLKPKSSEISYFCGQIALWFCTEYVSITAVRYLQFPLGAGNYQQPQLPSANMAGADLDTKLYSLPMQLLSAHAWC